MKKTFEIARLAMLIGVVALFSVGTISARALIDDDGGSCQKPKDSQCLRSNPDALGDWTPALQ